MAISGDFIDKAKGQSKKYEVKSKMAKGREHGAWGKPLPQPRTY
jgi:hypothetical protein